MSVSGVGCCRDVPLFSSPCTLSVGVMCVVFIALDECSFGKVRCLDSVVLLCWKVGLFPPRVEHWVGSREFFFTCGDSTHIDCIS